MDFKNEVDKLIKKGKGKDAAILSVIKGYIKESKAIRFEGDGYSESWKKEAEKRGLSNLPNTPDAIKAYTSKLGKDLFVKSGVFSEKEIEAHYEVMCENYILKLQIESRTQGEMVINHVLPAAIRYQSTLADNVQQLIAIDLGKSAYATQLDLVKKISKHINDIQKEVEKMTEARKKANEHKHASDVARAYCDKVKPLMESIRQHCDRLEYLVDDQEWPLVKYREMMFIR